MAEPGEALLPAPRICVPPNTRMLSFLNSMSRHHFKKNLSSKNDNLPSNTGKASNSPPAKATLRADLVSPFFFFLMSWVFLCFGHLAGIPE